MKYTEINISRRSAMKLMGGTAAAIAAPAVLTRAYAQESFSVGIPGGYEKAFQTAFLGPYEAEFGVKPTPILAGTSTVEIKAQVETGKFFYDVRFSVASVGHEILSKAGLLEPIAIETDDVRAIYEGMPENLRKPTFLPHGLSAQVIAYQAGLQFDSYADIWDIDGHPGERSLRGSAVDTIEAALRSLGKTPGETAAFLSTPAGWDAVFKRLDEIKPNVSVWWDEDSQIARLMGSGEIDVTVFPHHRAIGVVNDGGEIKFNYNQSIYDLLGWVIPKNSPKATEGRKFIEFCSRPDRIAEFTKQVPMGPMHPKVIGLLDPGLAITLPSHPDNLPKIAPLDTAFWASNQSKASERFREWLFG